MAGPKSDMIDVLIKKESYGHTHTEDGGVKGRSWSYSVPCRGTSVHQNLAGAGHDPPVEPLEEDDHTNIVILGC